MKILMFGRGVINAQYGWAFEKAGHEVEFYVRPGRAAQYGPSIDVDLLDGRKHRKGVQVKEKWPILLREEIGQQHNYDLIVVSLHHFQLEEAITLIKPVVGNATVLMFSNVWDDLDRTAASLPKNQVVWGFPGAGGGFGDSRSLNAGFMKTVYLETPITAASADRHESVAQLFRKAGFSLSLASNMRDWYWLHFIMNTGLAAMALKMGSYRDMFQSSAALGHAISIMGEMMPLIKAKGGSVGFGTKLLFLLPSGLTGFALKNILKDSLPLTIMERNINYSNASQDKATALFPLDALKEAGRLGVALPLLEKLKHHFTAESNHPV